MFFNKQTSNTNSSPKRGIALYFDILKREYYTLFKLNIFFIVASIPIITIGPALCAVGNACGRLVRDKSVDTLSDFIDDFKSSFKQGLVLSLIFILSVFLIAVSYIFYSSYMPTFSFVTLAILIIFTICFSYIVVIASNVHYTTSQVIKNSLVLMFSNVKTFLYVLILSILFLLINIGLFPYNIPLLLIISFSLHIFNIVFAVFPLLKKYVFKNNLEGDEE